MFRKDVQNIHDLLLYYMRKQGLETPLLQRRLIASWPEVAGEAISRYTTDVRIFNQTLYVKLTMPALRADLSMRRTELVQQLNNRVGAQIITDIRFT